MVQRDNVDNRPQLTKPVIVGRSFPIVPGQLVVAALAGLAGLMVGWSLAGNSRPTATSTEGPATSATIPPMVQPASVDVDLLRAHLESARSDAWLLCEKTVSLECRDVPPLQMDPSVAFGTSSGLWPLLTPVRLTVGGRLALVADLSFAVGAAIFIAPEIGGMYPPTEVTEAGGIHYLDLGMLSPGRYALVAEAELGPPAGGLVEIIGLDIVSP